MKTRPVIYIISDSVGETAEFVALAAASQFNSGKTVIHKIPYVNNAAEIPEIIAEASVFPSVIVYTLVQPGLREVLEREAGRYGIPTVDIMSPLIDALSKITGRPPKMEPGLVRKLDEEYFRKVDAVEFAVKYDAGKDPRGISKADLVIIGASRTSKTALCMFLAHKSVLAANIPLTQEVSPPEDLFSLPPHRIFGLTINPQLLYQIRCERLITMGLTTNADYASMERIKKELEYASSIMEKLKCPVIDVTNRAVEETATIIMDIYHKGEIKAREIS